MPAHTKLIAGALLLLMTAAPAVAQDNLLPAEQPPLAQRNASGDPSFDRCKVKLVDTVDLPAPEAGVLIFQGTKEGALVKSEDVIAKIDTRTEEMGKKIATYKYHAAVKRANDDIEIRYARKAAEHADETLKEIERVRTLMEKVVSNSEYRKTKLELERSLLAIENAENDRQLALLDAYALKGEVEAADLAIERRTVRAPFAGQVVEVFRHQSEWVNPGDPILRLVRMDTLRVDGKIQLQDYSPSEIAGCEVTIETATTKGRVEKATGRIVSISPILQEGAGGQEMIVHAEVANRTRDGHWVILPNMWAKMTIHLGTGGVATGRYTPPESTR